jgi:hypothetical protein
MVAMVVLPSVLLVNADLGQDQARRELNLAEPQY